MSNEKNNFTKNEKAKIALEAVSGNKEKRKELASKYGISEDEIMDWARELGVIVTEEKAEQIPDANESFKTADQVDLEVANQTFLESINFGVTIDNLNLKKLTFWTIFGTFLTLVIIFGLTNTYKHTIITSQQRVSNESTFYEISELKEKDRETLNSYGVVSPDEGIYRIPIDRAISITANNIE